jgi:hypothetical protein
LAGSSLILKSYPGHKGGNCFVGPEGSKTSRNLWYSVGIMALRVASVAEGMRSTKAIPVDPKPFEPHVVSSRVLTSMGKVTRYCSTINWATQSPVLTLKGVSV